MIPIVFTRIGAMLSEDMGVVIRIALGIVICVVIRVVLDNCCICVWRHATGEVASAVKLTVIKPVAIAEVAEVNFVETDVMHMIEHNHMGPIPHSSAYSACGGAPSSALKPPTGRRVSPVLKVFSRVGSSGQTHAA